MFNNGLSLQQSPPLKASIPFFITALLFLFIFSIVLFLEDINLFDRWLPDTIGLIHFFNIGFLVMVMLGALTQMLPVLAGVTIPKALITSRLVYLLVVIGAICFPFGMIFMKQWMIQLGAMSAWSGILIFYIIVLLSLRKGIPSFTVSSFKLSAISALMMLLFAGRLAWGWGFGEFSQLRIPLLELHIAWAIFGMAFILIMGVSYKVVPMFYVTADHPQWLTHYGAKILFSLLLSWTLIFQTFIFQKLIWLQSAIPFIKLGISSVIIIFCLETIKRFNMRKRALVDTSILYWKCSMLLFSLGAMLYGLESFFSESDKIMLFSSASFGMAFLSLITGMLYKIIPFLVWHQLTLKNVKSAPTMRELLPDRHARKQLYLHFAVIFFLTLSLFLPFFKLAFSLFFLFSLIATLILLVNPLRIYLRLISQI